MLILRHGLFTRCHVAFQYRDSAIICIAAFWREAGLRKGPPPATDWGGGPYLIE